MTTITPNQIDKAKSFQADRNAERKAKGKAPASATKFNMPSGTKHLNLEVDLELQSFCWRFVYNRPSTGALARRSAGVYPFKVGAGKKGKELEAARVIQDADIARAVALADEWNSMLSHGKDPGEAVEAAKATKAQALLTYQERQAAIDANQAVPGSFRWHMEAVLKHHAKTWSDDYRSRFENVLKRYAFPHFQEGNIDPKDITPEMVKRMREDAYSGHGKKANDYAGQATTMDKCMSFYRQVMVEAGIANPVEPVERSNKYVRPETESHAAITEPELVGKLLCDIMGYQGSADGRDADIIVLFTGQRTNVVHRIEWKEIDFTEAMWTIPRPKGKGPTTLKNSPKALKNPQRVPLSTQMINLLQRRLDDAQAEAKRTGKPMSKWVFPSRKRGATSGCLSQKTMERVLTDLGYGKETHVNHGSRTTFRSVFCRVYKGAQWGVICEAILEHKWGDVTKEQTSGLGGGTYLRVSIEERRECLQMWADLLQKLALEHQLRVAAEPAIEATEQVLLAA